MKVLLLFSSADIGGAERSLSRMALSNSNDSVLYQLSTFGNYGAWSQWVLSKNCRPICFDNSAWKLFKYIHNENIYFHIENIYFQIENIYFQYEYNSFHYMKSLTLFILLGSNSLFCCA